MTQEEAFTGAILKAPEDWTSYLVYADWLDERGRADDAFCFRWMGRRKRRPHRRLHYDQKPGVIAVPDKFGWGWYRLPTPSYRAHEFNPKPPSESWLPRTVFAAITSADHVYCLSWADAVVRLADALKQCREDLGCA